jgi:hypothetical protein
MRLAQLARKVNVKPTEIRSFIKDKFDTELDSDPNIKLQEEHVEAVKAEFKVEEVVVEEKVVEEKVEEVVEIEIDPAVETDLNALKEIAEEVAESAEPVEIPKVEEIKEEAPVTEAKEEVEEKAVEKKVVGINYDDNEDIESPKEDEPTTFEEVPVDREAELIAASVDKLEGLKVVGKIDLGTDEEEPELEDLPSADAIDEEIRSLDGETDTSEFTTDEELSDDKAAIFAELDAAMESKPNDKVKPVVKKVAEVSENIVEEDEEDSIYKDSNGVYHFTSEQKRNREESLFKKAEKARIEGLKKRKQRHYQENVASKVKAPKKKKKSAAKVNKEKAKSQKEAPKSTWKKFLNWLND